MGGLVPFKKGFDPRRGHVKGMRHITSLIRQALKQKAEKDGQLLDSTYEDLFIKQILKKATIDGDKDMIKLIWNYMDGLPQFDVTSGGRPIHDKMQEYGDDELRKIIAEAEALVEVS